MSFGTEIGNFKIAEEARNLVEETQNEWVDIVEGKR